MTTNRIVQKPTELIFMKLVAQCNFLCLLLTWQDTEFGFGGRLCSMAYILCTSMVVMFNSNQVCQLLLILIIILDSEEVNQNVIRPNDNSDCIPKSTEGESSSYK